MHHSQFKLRFVAISSWNLKTSFNATYPKPQTKGKSNYNLEMKLKITYPVHLTGGTNIGI